MLSDEVLGMFELCNDLLFGRIPKGRYRYYVEESLRLGREAAKKVKAQPAASAVPDRAAEKAEERHVDVSRIYQDAGIEIVYQESSGENCGVSFRAQSECGKDGSAKVLIYRQSIADLAALSACPSGAYPGIGEKEALDVHLAHEYFHYLEYHSGEIEDPGTMAYYSCGFVSGYLDQVELPGIFGRKRKAGILRCSEIAAHAFAKELTGLAVLPNYFDYAYLMSKGKFKEEEFFDKAQQLETLLWQSD